VGIDISTSRKHAHGMAIFVATPDPVPAPQKSPP